MEVVITEADLDTEEVRRLIERHMRLTGLGAGQRGCRALEVAAVDDALDQEARLLGRSEASVVETAQVPERSP